LTTQAAPEFMHVHDRMPVLVPLENPDLWLVDAQLDTLVASSGDGVIVWPVSSAVGSVANNNPGLITKAAAEYTETLFS
jgi:putative SOS response-associated peptidase YedK